MRGYKNNMGVPQAGRSLGRVIRSYCAGLIHGPVSATTANARVCLNRNL
jgi:hypothetical protein